MKLHSVKSRVVLTGASVLILSVGLLGLKFDWWGSDSSPQVDTQNHTNEEITPQPTKDQTSFKSKKQDLSFLHPKGWSVKEEGEGTLDAPYYITLKSGGITERDLEGGGSEVTKGARVNIIIGKTEGKTLEQIYKVGITGAMVDNGSIKPGQTKINNKEGVEFSVAFDGPETRTVYYLYDQNNYIAATLETEGTEIQHSSYSLYKQILESINL